MATIDMMSASFIETYLNSEAHLIVPCKNGIDTSPINHGGYIITLSQTNSCNC
jgi:hypothetical protein